MVWTPDAQRYPTPAALQTAILQQRRYVRSLLVLDNVETVVDGQRQGKAEAKALAAFLSRLKEGEGDLLITTRIELPADWGRAQSIRLDGLADDAGADLFLATLPPDRRAAAPEPSGCA